VELALSPEVVDLYQSQIIAHERFESPPLFQGPRLLVTAPLHKPALETLAMPMEPNRTRQVIQDLARAFNKLASELTADLSYAAREIDSLRKEVQRLRASSAKSNRTNGSSKKSTSHGTKTSGATHKNSTSHKVTSHGSQESHESPKPSHEPGSFVFPQEPFSPNPPAEPSSTGNN
jgi:hypothetical protein